MGIVFLVGMGLAFFACGPSYGGRTCTDLRLGSDDCNACLWQRCCTELSACDIGCVNCLVDGAATCNEGSGAVYACAVERCLAPCADQPIPASTTGAGGTGGITSTTGASGAGGGTSTTGTAGAGGTGGK